MTQNEFYDSNVNSGTQNELYDSYVNCIFYAQLHNSFWRNRSINYMDSFPELYDTENSKMNYKIWSEFFQVLDVDD
jgi:hypothetical protein